MVRQDLIRGGVSESANFRLDAWLCPLYKNRLWMAFARALGCCMSLTVRSFVFSWANALSRFVSSWEGSFATSALETELGSSLTGLVPNAPEVDCRRLDFNCE